MSSEAGTKPQGAPDAPKKPVGKGLGGMNLSGLLKTPVAAPAANGPIELDMSLIDEDANQPRTANNPGFSPDSIAEIGATIKTRGVKSPISVRENPDAPGRYLINHGARRFRGSKWAEKTTIPAFIDNDYNEADQVIENLQRNELTAREIADYIGRELAKGLKKGEIAKALGKSNAFVTQHSALLDLPDPIAEAFNTGRINDVTVINELVTAYKKKPQEVTDWLADETQEITRGSVKLLREFLEEGGRDPRTIDAFNGQTDEERENEDDENDDENREPNSKKDPKEQDPTKFKKAIIQVEINGSLARLLQTKRPTEIGLGWFKNEIDGEEYEAPLASAKMVALVEA